MKRAGAFRERTLRFEDARGFGRVLAPGDVVVYRERDLISLRDRVRRATFVRSHNGNAALEVTIGGVQEFIFAGDVLDVQPTQHGWCGAPASSGAW